MTQIPVLPCLPGLEVLSLTKPWCYNCANCNCTPVITQHKSVKTIQPYIIIVQTYVFRETKFQHAYNNVLLHLATSSIISVQNAYQGNNSVIFRRPIHSMGRLYISRCVCVCPSGHLNRFGPMNFSQNPLIVSSR